MTQAIPLGQTGVALIIRAVRSDGTPEDLSTSTSLEMSIRGPSGPTQLKQASLTSGGGDGMLQYVTQAGDLNEAGKWEYQGHWMKDGAPRHTHRGAFRVDPLL